MGNSHYTVGIRPPDEKWLEMKAIWDSCKTAGVEVPDVVIDFFDDREPDPKGIEIELQTHEGNDEYREWHSIAVADIPKNITEIRFVASG